MTLELSVQDDANPAGAHQYSLPLDGSGGPVVLGRGPESPVPLEGTKISRQHVAFTIVAGRLTVTDISSTGVWVNERAMPKNSPVTVEPLDEIRLPGYRLFASVKGLEPSPVAPPPPVARTDQFAVQPRPALSARPAAVAPPEPAWWKPDARERWALFLLVATGLFILLYRSL